MFAAFHKGARLDEVFAERRGGTLPETLNQEHQLLSVASELDNSTERIVRYLTEEFSVPVGVLFFRYHRDGDREYRHQAERPVGCRGDRREAPADQDRQGALERGELLRRGREDARTGTTGQRRGHLRRGRQEVDQRAQQLFVGARVFAYIPQVGCVGVGTVPQTATPVTEFCSPSAPRASH